jgi:hypothetical protein
MYSQPIMEISGKPAISNYGFIAPGFFGRTKLTLSENRVIEDTKRIVASRKCEFILSEVDSVEISEDGNPILLSLGFFTLFFYGIGIIFFVLYFIFKYQYLIIRSGANVQVMSIPNSSTMEKAKAFMDKVLATAESAKYAQKG